MSENNTPPATTSEQSPGLSVPAGSPIWLRAIADEQEEMFHAIGSLDKATERATKREILGLRAAANDIENLRKERDEARRYAEVYRKIWEECSAAIDNSPNSDPLPWANNKVTRGRAQP